MIKQTELRVGNWVSYFDKYYLVKGMRHENSSFYISGVENMNHLTKVYNVEDTFDPIPLTPEILEKCGFMLDKSGDFYTINDLISFSIDEFKNITQTWIYTDKKFRAINYLHELQNLYFALTDQELEVNLNAEVSDTKFHLR